jgi:hypothetical protein
MLAALLFVGRVAAQTAPSPAVKAPTDEKCSVDGRVVNFWLYSRICG